MSYIVEIKELSTGSVRIRREGEAWRNDRLVWTRGHRACDCNRAMLFAAQDESAKAYCGVDAFAIRVTDINGREIYCEAEFGPVPAACLSDKVCPGGIAQIPLDGAIDNHRAAMRARIGALARQIFDRLSVPVVRPDQEMLAGPHHDERL